MSSVFETQTVRAALKWVLSNSQTRSAEYEILFLHMQNDTATVVCSYFTFLFFISLF